MKLVNKDHEIFLKSKSKIQKENPFRFFYEGFPTAYSMQN